MADNVFEAKQLPVGDVFSDKYIFEMPRYQRPYAWTESETEELLSDLTSAVDDEGSSEEQPYFLGSIVLIDGQGSKTYKVVDGQQRLTTLTILLCVLRDLSDNKDVRDELHSFVCEKKGVIAGTKERFRLSIRELDNDFFRRNVQTEGGLEDFVNLSSKNLPDAHKRILENAKFLWESLRLQTEDRRERLASFIIQNCYFVVVSAMNDDAARRIFSVLNARGLELLPTDILKSEIIGQVRSSNEIDYTQKWESIEEELGRDNFNDLFMHIHMIYVKKKPSKKSLDKSFKEEALPKMRFPGGFDGEKFIDGVLQPYKEAYQVVTDSAYEGEDEEISEEINRHLQNLNRITNIVSFWIAPAMEFYKQRGDYDDGKAFLKLIKDLERLTYGLLFLTVSRDSRRFRYEKVLEVFENNEGAIFEDALALQLSDAEKSEILNGLDEPLQQRLLKPLLLLLDGLYADTGVTYANKTITVEHVLPQNPDETSDWVKHFPDKDMRAEWTHKLANLVLLSRSKNSKAQNYEFERKKNEYFLGKTSTTFTLTQRAVMDKTEWTPKVLERRQKGLIDALKKEWRLD